MLIIMYKLFYMCSVLYIIVSCRNTVVYVCIEFLTYVDLEKNVGAKIWCILELSIFVRRFVFFNEESESVC